MNAGMWVGVAIAVLAVLVFFVGVTGGAPGGVGTSGLGGIIGGTMLLIVAVVVFGLSWLV